MKTLMLLGAVAALSACGGTNNVPLGSGINPTTGAAVADSSTMRATFASIKHSNGAPPSGPGCLAEQDDIDYTSSTSNKATITPHSTVYPGELVLLAASYNSKAGTPSAPGFTEYGQPIVGGVNDAIANFYKIATASEPSSYTVSLSGSAGDTLNVKGLIYSDENQSNPFYYEKGFLNNSSGAFDAAGTYSAPWSSIGVAFATDDYGSITNVPSGQFAWALDDVMATHWHPLASYGAGNYPDSQSSQPQLDFKGNTASAGSGRMFVINPAHPLQYGQTPCTQTSPTPAPTASPVSMTQMWSIGNTYRINSEGAGSDQPVFSNGGVSMAINRPNTSSPASEYRDQINVEPGGNAYVFVIGNTYSVQFQTSNTITPDQGSNAGDQIWQLRNNGDPGNLGNPPGSFSINTINGASFWQLNDNVISGGGPSSVIYSTPYVAGGTTTWRFDVHIAKDTTGYWKIYKDNVLVSTYSGPTVDKVPTSPMAIDFGAYESSWKNIPTGSMLLHQVNTYNSFNIYSVP